MGEGEYCLKTDKRDFWGDENIIHLDLIHSGAEKFIYKNFFYKKLYYTQ